MKKLAIVGIFFDGYYDMWEDFLELYYRNWKDCPYPLYIVNNDADLHFQKKYPVNVIHAGADAEYSRKVQIAIEQIDADYYLLLLEDFLIGKKLQSDVLSEVMRFIVDKKIKYYQMPMREFTAIKNINRIIPIMPQMEYTFSCQPSIWQKNFLQKCIGTGNYNAWVFEGIYTKSRKARTKHFLKDCYKDYRNLLCLYHGALQGKMLPKTYKHFSKQGYHFKSKREVLSRKKEFISLGKTQIKGLIPYRFQKRIKGLTNNNSVIERYNQDIYRLIKEMDLD